MRADGEIGKYFLLAKISGYMVCLAHLTFYIQHAPAILEHESSCTIVVLHQAAQAREPCERWMTTQNIP